MDKPQGKHLWVLIPGLSTPVFPDEKSVSPASPLTPTLTPAACAPATAVPKMFREFSGCHGFAHAVPAAWHALPPLFVPQLS